jgi:hypothetical protein
VTGRALQGPYDPFLDRHRARTEELGDCLAEGLFWLLDTGRSIKDADVRYWEESLNRRLEFIAEVVAMVTRWKGDNGKKRKMLGSLRVARARCERITPELCTDYVSLWQGDRDRWRRHLDERQEIHGTAANVEKVLASLGLAVHSRYLSS